MIAVIAKKEFICRVRDGRFRRIAAIMALLLLTSLWTGYSRYQSLRSVQTVAQATTDEQSINQGDKNPHTAAHFGKFAFKAPVPLSSFDIGISNYAGGTVWLEAHKTNFAKNRPAQDNGGLSRFGELTPAMAAIPAPYIMICGVLVPLAILLVAVLLLYPRRIVVAEKSFALCGAGRCRRCRYPQPGCQEFLMKVPSLATDSHNPGARP